jgi:hypothetical protein
MNTMIYLFKYLLLTKDVTVHINMVSRKATLKIISIVVI